MRLTGTKTVREEFDISEEDVLDAAIKIIKERHNLLGEYEIVDGKLINVIEKHGPHCEWFEREEIRTATDLDHNLIQMIDYINVMKDTIKSNE
jgi:hypothetical protein